MQTLFAAEFLFIMIFFFINGASSLNCYVCRSDEQDQCNGNINMTYSVACPAKPNATKIYCRKIRQKLKFRNDDDFTYIRECAYEKGSKDCYLSHWIELAVQETCECDIDLCNAGYMNMPKIRMLILAFFPWIFKHVTV